MEKYSILKKRTFTKVGLKESLKALRENQVKKMFVAKNADYFVLRLPIELAQKNSVPIVEIETKEKLGKLCNIDISAAIAVVINTNK